MQFLLASKSLLKFIQQHMVNVTQEHCLSRSDVKSQRTPLHEGVCESVPACWCKIIERENTHTHTPSDTHTHTLRHTHTHTHTHTPSDTHTHTLRHTHTHTHTHTHICITSEFFHFTFILPTGVKGPIC